MGRKAVYDPSTEEGYDALEQLAAKLNVRGTTNVTPIFSRKQIEQAFLETFDLVGGVPRLALWANQEENYSAFLQLLLKLAPKEAPAIDEANIGGRVLSAVTINLRPVASSVTTAQADTDITDVEC